MFAQTMDKMKSMTRNTGSQGGPYCPPQGHSTFLRGQRKTMERKKKKKRVPWQLLSDPPKLETE